MKFRGSGSCLCTEANSGKHRRILRETIQGHPNGLITNWQMDKFGWNVHSSYVHRIPDALDALEIAISVFCEDAPTIIVPTPAYPPFLQIPQELGCRVIEVPLARTDQRWELDMEGIEDALSAGGAMVLLCNPHNPTGTQFAREELITLSHIVSRYGARVFADEVHAPINYGVRPHVPYASLNDASASHTVTVVSAAKAWNIAGLKCAELILSNSADNQRWKANRAFRQHGVSVLGVVAAVAALRDGQEWFTQVMKLLTANRKYLATAVNQEFGGVRLSSPDATYLGWLEMRSLRLESPVEFLRSTAGVSVTAGEDFGRVGRGFVRLNFAMSECHLRSTLSRMAVAIQASTA